MFVDFVKVPVTRVTGTGVMTPEFQIKNKHLIKTVKRFKIVMSTIVKCKVLFWDFETVCENSER